MGIKLYNKLPNTIKRLDKMQEFKSKLKYFFNATHFLLSERIYVPNRYHCHLIVGNCVHFIPSTL